MYACGCWCLWYLACLLHTLWRCNLVVLRGVGEPAGVESELVLVRVSHACTHMHLHTYPHAHAPAHDTYASTPTPPPPANPPSLTHTHTLTLPPSLCRLRIYYLLNAPMGAESHTVLLTDVPGVLFGTMAERLDKTALRFLPKRERARACVCMHGWVGREGG